MPTVDLTSESFQSILDDNEMLIIDFWASWCGPCRRFAPVFEAASDNHPDVVFGKVDTEAQAELAGAFGVRSIPTLIVFRQKVMLFNQAGMLPPAALEDLIGKVKALDMDEVHQAIAERDAVGDA